MSSWSNCLSVRQFCAVWVGALFVAVNASAYAATPKLSDLLEVLSTARGDAVGRAARVQSCDALRDQRLLTELVLKYDDARTAHNARIDSWIFGLKSKLLANANLAMESQNIADARRKLEIFKAAAQSALTREGCPIKVIWPTLGVGVGLLALDKLLDYFMSVGDDQKLRDELIRELGVYRLPPWESVSVAVAFNWSTQEYLVGDNVTMGDLLKGGTSVYVNKVLFEKPPNQFFTTAKELPPALAGAYLLYTGPLEKLPEFTGSKKKMVEELFRNQ